MARTVKTVTADHRTGNCDNHTCASGTGTDWRVGVHAHHVCTHAGPNHELRDLRFHALGDVTAARLGVRPQPQPVRVTIPKHMRYGRGYNESVIGHYARTEERKARAGTRKHLNTARRLANTLTADETWTDALDDVDVPPTRHRYSAAWLSW